MNIRRPVWSGAGALLLTGAALLSLGACGGPAASTAACSSSASASPGIVLASGDTAATSAGGTSHAGEDVVAGVRAAVERYLAARDRVLVPGADIRDLVRCLRPGSPAGRQEPRVAAGRTILAARAGVSYATARTEAAVAAGAVSLYDGATPLATGAAAVRALTEDGRAVVVASCESRFTLSDLTALTVREDHVVVLSPSAQGWRVFSDQYAAPALAAWLRAGGASLPQVRAARVWATQAAQARRRSVTPVSTVRAFVAALDARRYPQADLFLDPAFGGTAQGMAMWLESIRFESARPFGVATTTEAHLRVTLQVRPRASSWNSGANERFVTLTRRTAGEPWRIGALHSGP
jgi:hypothetical protein